MEVSRPVKVTLTSDSISKLTHYFTSVSETLSHHSAIDGQTERAESPAALGQESKETKDLDASKKGSKVKLRLNTTQVVFEVQLSAKYHEMTSSSSDGELSVGPVLEEGGQEHGFFVTESGLVLTWDQLVLAYPNSTSTGVW